MGITIWRMHPRVRAYRRLPLESSERARTRRADAPARREQFEYRPEAYPSSVLTISSRLIPRRGFVDSDIEEAGYSPVTVMC